MYFRVACEGLDLFHNMIFFIDSISKGKKKKVNVIDMYVLFSFHSTRIPNQTGRKQYNGF